MPGPDADRWTGIPVHGPDGKQMGTVTRAYADVGTGEPTWVTVKVGPWKRDHRTVPLAAAEVREGRLLIPYTYEKVQDSPFHDPDEDLGEEKVHSLSLFYEVAEKEKAKEEMEKKHGEKKLAEKALEEKEHELKEKELELKETELEVKEHELEEKEHELEAERHEK